VRGTKETTTPGRLLVTCPPLVPPIITCPGQPIRAEADGGSCGTTIASSPTASDCDPITVVTDPPVSNPGGAFIFVGTTEVTATATDAENNSATCKFNVEVTDSVPPSVTKCPSSTQTKFTDPGKCSTVFDTKPLVEFQDNCLAELGSDAFTNNQPQPFPLGESTVTATVTDTGGSTATCVFNVKVEDNEDPVFQSPCPAPITTNTMPEGTCGARVTFNIPAATDNCNNPPEVSLNASSGDIFPLGPTTVTITAKDAAGNTDECAFTVTVNDEEKPKIDCPNDIVVETPSADATVNFNAPVATDNCGVTSVQVNARSGDKFPKTTTTVTAKATDQAGNTDECQFTITVRDGGAAPPPPEPILPFLPPNFICFSPVNTVEVKGKGVVSMNTLKIGDLVRAGENKFTQVIGFIHHDHIVEADFLQIHAAGLKAPLEISHDHMVFVDNAPIRASHVKLGDVLSGSGSEQHKVSEIKIVKRRGVYAPLTETGTLHVNGALASSYAAVLAYSPVNQHYGAHAFFAIRRLICAFNAGICKGESYTNGFPDWLFPAIRFMALTQQYPAVQVCSSFVALPFITAAYLLEQLVLSPYVLTMLIVGLFVFKKMKFGNAKVKVL